MKLKSVIGVVVLLLVVAALFTPSLGFGFINYDDDLYAANPLLGQWFQMPASSWLLTPHIGYPIPLPVALWSLLHSIVPADRYPLACHLLSLGVHLVNVVLLFALLRRVRASAITWLAVLWFATHPLVVEPVVWTTGLKELLVTTGFLLAALGFCRAVDDGRWSALLGILGVVVAFASKPTAVVLGPLLLLMLFIFRGNLNGRQPRVWLGIALTSTVFGMFHALATLSSHTEFGGQLEDAPLWGRVIAAAALQLEHLLVPLNLRIHYLYEVPGIREYLVVLSVAIVCVVTGILAFRRMPLFFSGLAWAVAAYLPYSGVAQQSRFTADSYMYLPLAGLSLAIVAASIWTGRRYARVWPAVLGIALVVNVVAAIIELQDWRGGGERHWEEAMLLYPDVPFFAMKLAQTRYERGDFEGAIAAFEAVDTKAYGTTTPFDARYPIAYCSIGELERCEELFLVGLTRLRAAQARHPSDSQARDLEFLEENYRRFLDHYKRPDRSR